MVDESKLHPVVDGHIFALSRLTNVFLARLRATSVGVRTLEIQVLGLSVGCRRLEIQVLGLSATCRRLEIQVPRAFRHLAEIKIDHNGGLIKGLQMC